MVDTVFVTSLLLIITNLAAFAIKDPIPFGNERLNDFFFVKNGTIFHQFVCIIFIFFYHLHPSFIIHRIMERMVVLQK
jgi:hypothetical protein